MFGSIVLVTFFVGQNSGESKASDTARAVPARPQISVVIAAWTNERNLERCLAHISDENQLAEVIVALNYPTVISIKITGRYPGVIFVRGENDASVFALRALGASRARGRLIAFIEDHCTVSPTWCKSLIAAHRSGYRVLGGPVGNGHMQRAYDWALYFSEYGFYVPPIAEGLNASVSGVNVAYDEELLRKCRPVWEEALYETEVNDAMRELGHSPYGVSGALVTAHLPFRFATAIAHLYAGGRHFGQIRALRNSMAKRLVLLVASPLVTIVLFSRIIWRVVARNPNWLPPLARSAGYLILLLCAWSAGESVGYLRGLRKFSS